MMKEPPLPRTRRELLCNASAGVALAASARAQTGDSPGSGSKDRLPREIWVASVTQEGLRAADPEQMIKAVLARMEETVAYQPDIVCTPEVFAFSNVARGPRVSSAAEKPIGPVCAPFAEFAKKHHCYVVCSTYTEENARYYNSAVLLDRAGKPVGEYRKIHPTVGEIENEVSPGPLDPPVFRTDFGVVGFQICFDINWPEGWRKLRKAGAELVFWPSAFGGGSMLNALAWQNKYYVVSSTRKGLTKMCDISGEEMASTGWMRPFVCAPVNLEKAFIHAWPFSRQHRAIQAKYGRDVRIKVIHENEWTIMESRAPDLKIADVLKEFGIPTHEEYIAQAEAAQDTRRKA